MTPRILGCLCMLAIFANCHPEKPRVQGSSIHVGSASGSTVAPDTLKKHRFLFHPIPAWGEEDADSIGLYTSIDSGQYGNYEVKSFRDTVDGRSFVAVASSQSQIAGLGTNDNGYGSGPSFWIDSLLGAHTQQVVLHVYTGGAHCCDLYTIIDLTDTGRVVYDDNHYTDMQYWMDTPDLDSDGVKEIVRCSGLFDYFLASHALSSFPIVVLKYSRTAGRYVPTPQLFRSYFQHYIDSLIQECKDCDAHPEWGKTADCRERCAAPILSVLFQYIYAGRRDEGWHFYDEHYRAADRDSVRTLVDQLLKTSPVYKEIYPR